MVEALEFSNRLFPEPAREIIGNSIRPPIGPVEDRSGIPTKPPNLVKGARRLPRVLRPRVEHANFCVHL